MEGFSVYRGIPPDLTGRVGWVEVREVAIRDALGEKDFANEELSAWDLNQPLTKCEFTGHAEFCLLLSFSSCTDVRVTIFGLEERINTGYFCRGDRIH